MSGEGDGDEHIHDGEHLRVGDAARDGETRLAERSRAPPVGPREGDGDAPARDVAVAFPERDPGELDDATELYLMEQYAAPDGTVTAQVLGWEREGDVVRVDYALPTGERRSDRYRWPTPGRYDDSDFVRLVRGLGYTPATAEHVAGEFGRARTESDRWRLVTGRQWDGESDSGDPHSDPGDAGDGWVTSRLPLRLRRWLADVDPMDLGTASVLCVFLAVMVPAALAAATGGLSTGLALLGGGFLVGAAVSLWLSLVAAEL